MNGAQAIGIFGLLSAAAGVWALVWAARNGQFRESDESASSFVRDRDPVAEPAADRSRSPLAKLTLAIIVGALVFIAWSIAITVYTATRAADDAQTHHMTMPF